MELRQKVEVVVIRGQRICLCFPTGNKPWFNFPGGGIEAGEDLFVAARRECLEEVGLIVDPKNFNHVKGMKEEFISTFSSDKPFGDKKQYNGTQVTYVIATFEKEASERPEVDDARPFRWLTVEKAIQFLTVSQFDQERKRVLGLLKKYGIVH